MEAKVATSFELDTTYFRVKKKVSYFFFSLAIVA